MEKRGSKKRGFPWKNVVFFHEVFRSRKTWFFFTGFFTWIDVIFRREAPENFFEGYIVWDFGDFMGFLRKPREKPR